MRIAFVVGVLACSLAIGCSQEKSGTGAQNLDGAGAEPAPAAPPSAAAASTSADARSTGPAAGPPPVETVLIACTKQGDPSTSARVTLDDQNNLTWKLGTDQATAKLIEAAPPVSAASYAFLQSTGYDVGIDPVAGKISVPTHPDFACDTTTMQADAKILDAIVGRSHTVNSSSTDLATCHDGTTSAFGPQVWTSFDGKGLLIGQGGPDGVFSLDVTEIITSADGTVSYNGAGGRAFRDDDTRPLTFTALTAHPNGDGTSTLTWVAARSADSIVYKTCYVFGADDVQKLFASLQH